VPASVADAARQRSEARAAGDWGTADRLRAEIEAAGWRVIDRGVKYKLAPASPPSIAVAGDIRYGRSDDVPSRLDEPPDGLATVIVLGSDDAPGLQRSLDAIDGARPAGVDVVVVVDGRDIQTATDHEVIRTSAPLGRGAALNIGLRRARAEVVVAVDVSIIPSGDVVTPLVEALRDPGVAVVGALGLASSDLLRFESATASIRPVDVAAIQGDLMAFRRADAAARGPIDEGFRSAGFLDVWLSLLLRDEGEGRTPRRAVVVPGLPFERAEPAPDRPANAARRERLTRRNFYRVLDSYRTRPDLAVPEPVVRSGTDS